MKTNINSLHRIDHIVLAVPTLEEGILFIEKKLGVTPIYGGQHQTEGTHNALLNLGNHCYLELLAIDDSNQKISPPRWMGIDLIDEPIITRWAIKTDNLTSDVDYLKNVNPLLGNYKSGMRKKSDGSILQWQLSIPLPNPKIEITPFLLNWGKSIHPTMTLPEDCQLISLQLKHPEPTDIQSVMTDLHLDFQIKKANQAKISITIQSPNGIVEL